MTSRTAWWIAAGVALLVLSRSGLVDALAEAIGYVESHGNYQAIGPLTVHGRAYGKYQVLETNIAPWTQLAVGRAFTTAAFLNDPRVQDATVRDQVRRLLARYGNPADVASVWFSGRPLSQAGNASDVTGTTVPAYVQAVLARL